MVIKTEAEMLEYGRKLAGKLLEQGQFPAVIELIGDVGAGKTTLTRGLAEGLGVKEAVTSPSFTLSKRYAYPAGMLIHYDFYRLNEPGIMREELAEVLELANAVVVVEWGESVADLLPEDKMRIEIKYREDGAREIVS